jgi:hemin uptake protein HemP
MSLDETPTTGSEKEKSEENGNEPAGDAESRPRRLRSSDLFRDGARRVFIRHNERDYVLIITKSGKLLLNLAE